MTTQEHDIERYMRAITNPKSLIDEDRIGELEGKLAEATSPLERLKLHSQIQELKSPSTDGLEDAFIEQAESWAAANNITAEAFLAEGVPADVLVRAGFKLKARGRRKQITQIRPRAPRVSKETIREAIPASGLFTIAQLVKSSGGTEATVRKTITEELEKGTVVEQGADESHVGRGKAPIRYERAN